MENTVTEEYFKQEYYKPLDEKTISYWGFLFLENKFQEYISTRVKEKFEDLEWTNRLALEAEQALKDTGFTAENFIEIFSNREMENNWRIGEYLAECVLEDKFNAKFYYNSSRDAKNPKGNDTGADLVGLCEVEGESCFLFGEVKTSNDSDSPPNVLYGRTGMVYQLESLRDNAEKRDDLVKWIWTKAVLMSGSFKDECTIALKNYYQSSKTKVKLVGVLVRDTEVNYRDLHSRAKALNKNIPGQMIIELVGVYSGYKMENDNWVKALRRSG
ncbi:hypothetical protein FB379_12223 [Aeribacillus composti]|uniref:hypothetical protein n=1 Tax=Aeribacillus composti TaxID=1868734 RepID=UPI00119B2C5D|nr:hypothetical protein [Aeribacillus composti]TVZ79626.1 hypothetical protein FB379_12223 [Aeribacillus composti]